MKKHCATRDNAGGQADYASAVVLGHLDGSAVLISCDWCGCTGRKDIDIRMTCVGIGAYVDLCPTCREQI